MADEKKLGLHEEREVERSFDWQIMKKLSVFTKPYMKLLIICATLLILVTAIDLIKPVLIKVAIDDHINGYQRQWYEVSHAAKGQKEVVLEGRHFVRADWLKSPEAQARRYTLVHLESKAYLVKGYDEEKTYRSLSDLKGSEYRTLTQSQWQLFRSQDKNGVYQLALFYFVLILIGFLLTYVQLLLLNHVSQKLICDMRAHLFDHLMKLPLSFYDKNPVGRLVTRVTNDMKNISDMYTDVLINLLNDLLLLLGTLVIMLTLNWRLALIALSTVPLVTLASYWFRIKAREAHREVKAKIARINATLSENISGMRIVQLFHREEDVASEFDEINRDHLKSSLKELQVFGVFRPSMNLLYTLSLTLLIWYSAPKVLLGHIELGVLFALINYTDQFFKPIFDLSEKFNILQSAMASSERVFMLLEENVHEEEGQLSIPKEAVEGHVVFEDVSFAYTEGEPVLKHIDLKIEAGQTVALVGATGSGKTTMMSLLSGLYPVKQGRILIDGHDINDFSKKSLRKLIGIVLQDVFLFAGNIKDNISLGDAQFSEEEIREKATYVNADAFIHKLSKGYDEVVYERGSTLSTGQRQLLAFARALVYNPKILVLDEATASIDTETEHQITDAIEKLTKGRTTIVIAHRLSTIQNADQIVVLHKGRIREVGTHETLLKQGGLYYDLYRLQYSHS